MILVADSGSTKTHWAIANDPQMEGLIETMGLNPFMRDDDDILQILENQLLPNLPDTTIRQLHFYGAGCRPEQAERMTCLLQRATGAEEIHVNSDLLGACHALCGHEKGQCAILGTGSASCLYDGEKIVRQTPSLGFILGDEGSGSVLGRRLISDLYKGQLTARVAQAFDAEFTETVSVVLDKIYRQSAPNRYLASFAPFIARHRDDDSIHFLLVHEFRRFARRNLQAYGHREMPVNFVGSIAWNFQKELAEALRLEGFEIGEVLQNPIGKMIKFVL